jgi:hypothetical protein
MQQAPSCQLLQRINHLTYGPLYTPHSIWLLWNEHLHGTPSIPLHSIKHLQLLTKILSLYNMAPSMLASDHAIFDYPLAKRQKHLSTLLRNFLHFASPIIKCSINKAKIIGTCSKPINTYFGPRFPIPPSLYDVILHPLVDQIE